MINMKRWIAVTVGFAVAACSDGVEDVEITSPTLAEPSAGLTAGSHEEIADPVTAIARDLALALGNPGGRQVLVDAFR